MSVLCFALSDRSCLHLLSCSGSLLTTALSDLITTSSLSLANTGICHVNGVSGGICDGNRCCNDNEIDIVLSDDEEDEIKTLSWSPEDDGKKRMD